MSDIKQYGSYFTFGDIVSSDYYVWISGTGTYGTSQREMSFLTVPGRWGDLLEDGKRFGNIDITYPCFIAKSFPDRFAAFRAAMAAKAGQYLMLSYTYHPGEFRLAAFRGKLTPETGIANKSGSFDVTFNCKPQRYLNSGTQIQTLTATGTITNPTLFTARPNIRVYGQGALGVNGDTITITENSFPYIDIDSEAMSAFYVASNANGYIATTGDDFPLLQPGVNNISLGSGITRIEVQPRWFTL